MPSADTIDDVRRDALNGIALVFCPVGTQNMKMSGAHAEPAAAGEWEREIVRAAPTDVPALAKVIRGCAPDFVVVDPFLLTSSTLAAVHVEGVPYALLWANLIGVAPKWLRTFRKGTDEAMQDMLSKFGVDWSDAFASPRSRILNMAPVVPELIGGEVAGIHLVGFPGSPERRGDEVDFDSSTLPASPFVYVSFGSMLEHPALLEIIFRATRRLGLRVVASVGRLVAELGDCGDHVVLARYVPQREVLQRASLFVTHGGYNSVAEGLRAGTPMLVVPLLFDQPIQAHYVTETGAGLALPPTELTEDSAAEALSALSTEASYRAQATRFARLAASTDPTETKVNLILRFCA